LACWSRNSAERPQSLGSTCSYQLASDSRNGQLAQNE